MQNLGVNPNIELRLNLWITHRYVWILLNEPCPSRRKKEGEFSRSVSSVSTSYPLENWEYSFGKTPNWSP